MIRGVILDIDGTLILSNDAHAEAWVDAFAQEGFKITFSSVRPLMGMGGDKVIPSLNSGLSKEVDPGKTIAKTHGKIFIEKYLPHLKPAPGTRDFIKALLKSRLNVIAATSSDEKLVSALLKKAGIDDLVTRYTTASDVEKSKPNPDIIKTTLEKIKLDPKEVIMFGDTKYDIEAASKCQVAVIAFRCGGSKDADLKGALSIYNDPADFMEEQPSMLPLNY